MNYDKSEYASVEPDSFNLEQEIKDIELLPQATTLQKEKAKYISIIMRGIYPNYPAESADTLSEKFDALYERDVAFLKEYAALY